MTAQEEFDEAYITSSEICKELEVTRKAIVDARRRGDLPDPIVVNGQILIWKRRTIRPHLESWKQTLRTRRKEATG